MARFDENKTHILGCKIDLYSKDKILEQLTAWLRTNEFHHIVTLNPEICLLAKKDFKYREILKHVELTVADGIGLQIARFILGAQRFPRVTGRALVNALCFIARKQNKKVFLLGGKRGVALSAGAKLKSKFPNLQIVGATHGMEKDEFTLENEELITQINESRADILLVAFGAPKQEKWIEANRKQLETVKIAVGIGGVLDYLSGIVKTPPRWMAKLGLEWLFRLITQPSRILRIAKAVIVFPIYAIFWRLRMTFVFRKNVVAMIRNDNNEIFVGSPWWSNVVHWQFPQGGVDRGEDAKTAIIREMFEELGTDKFIVQGHKPSAHAYTWNRFYRLIRGYRGQKQDLFLLKFYGQDTDFNIQREGELTKWKWVPYDQILKVLAPVRKSIGKVALEFSSQIDSQQNDQ